MKPGDVFLKDLGEDAAASAAAPPLPCLNSNISITPPLSDHIREGLNRLSTNHRKTAFKLANCVGRLCSKYGIERIGFLTLTFADHVTCAKEAGKRFNSLRSNVLAHRYVESICVLERMKSGRIHFHLLVVLADDIRTGFDFVQAAKGTYSSANLRLRSEWAFWRENARSYGFGRTELMPVKSNEEGLSKYVGKYIAKHVGAREERDKGVRLVRYSRGASNGSVAFMFASPRSRLWRYQVGAFAKRNDCADLAALVKKFGSRWAYYRREEIMSIEPPPVVVCSRIVDGISEPVTLTDVFEADRFFRSEEIAKATGATQAEVYMAMRPGLVESLNRARDPEGSAKVKAALARAYDHLLGVELREHERLMASQDESGEVVDRVTIWTC